MEIREIQAYIEHDRQERDRKQKLFDYYRGKNDILNRAFADASKPNNKLAHGYPRLISNAYTGYLFGEPVTYSAEDDRLLRGLLDCLRYNDEAAVNAQLGLDTSICGIAVEVMYIDKWGEARFSRVDPVGCIPIYEETIERPLKALIRYYETYDVVERTFQGHVDVYEPDAICRYDCPRGFAAGGALTFVEEQPHAWGDVPATVWQNGAYPLGDFEGVLSLIDAYDIMQSEAINDQEYFSDAYLKMHGIGELSADDVAEMKRNRVLLMPNDADADWLIKQQSDTLPENIKDRLNMDIHRFSGCPDMSDENFAQNASGVAIRYKLLQFENIAGMKEREYKKALQRRVELLMNIFEILGRGRFDWREVTPTFTRALPQNLTEIAQAVGTLGGIISDETKRSLLPIDIDEETEKARLEAETAQKTAIYGPNDVFGEEPEEEIPEETMTEALQD